MRVSRGWEDFWGRVRRIQYPTILGVLKEPSGYRSYASYTTVRVFEKDLEFNVPTRWLQLRILATLRAHVKVKGYNYLAYLGYRIYWNDVEIKPWTLLTRVGISTAYDPSTTVESTGDVKFLLDLGEEEVRGKLRVEFGTYLDYPEYHEAEISEATNKVEVGVYEW